MVFIVSNVNVADKTVKKFDVNLSGGKWTVAEKSAKAKHTHPVDFQDTWYYLGFIGEIGFSIAIPIATGALLGTYIDRHLGIYPKATLFLLCSGIFISVLTFIRTLNILLKKK